MYFTSVPVSPPLQSGPEIVYTAGLFEDGHQQALLCTGTILNAQHSLQGSYEGGSIIIPTFLWGHWTQSS